MKIIGNHSSTFIDDVVELIKQHDATFDAARLRQTLSKNDRFVALHAVVHAPDQATLDALYMAITQHPDARMVL